MLRLLLVILAGAGLALAGGGCAWHKKPQSRTHIYGGDGPSIKMSDPESAGGALRTY